MGFSALDLAAVGASAYTPRIVGIERPCLDGVCGNAPSALELLINHIVVRSEQPLHFAARFGKLESTRSSCYKVPWLRLHV